MHRFVVTLSSFVFHLPHLLYCYFQRIYIRVTNTDFFVDIVAFVCGRHHDRELWKMSRSCRATLKSETLGIGRRTLEVESLGNVRASTGKAMVVIRSMFSPPSPLPSPSLFLLLFLFLSQSISIYLFHISFDSIIVF